MTVNSDIKVGGLLLAAGTSKRMGHPKQLLTFNGKSLLRIAAETLVNSNCDPVIVIIGNEQEAFSNQIADLSLVICLNEDWLDGLSSSIKTGLRKLIAQKPDVAAVVIMLCDQPLVTSSMISRLTDAFAESHSPIVAAEYDGIAGVPALFSHEMFEQLSKLDGDKGARDLIRGGERVVTVSMPEAAFDVDTLADYKKISP